jgi:4-hydroxy-3-methylbut-2-enyl diphosphate reductase IspH
VVGDTHSNNAQQLIALGKKQKLSVYAGNDIKSFNNLNLKLQKYAITSSTSTSNYVVEQIADRLLQQYGAKTPKLNKLNKSK